MSDQTVDNAQLYWQVDWSAARTWGKFFGLCSLFPLVILASNILAFGTARMIAFPELDLATGASRHLVEGALGLPFLHRLAAIIAACSVQILLIIWWARRIKHQSVPDNFPMDAVETEKKSHGLWVLLIVTLYYWQYKIADSLELGIFSVNDENWGPYSVGIFIFFLIKDDLRVLFWHVLGDNGPPSGASQASQHWVSQHPALTLAVLSVVGFFTLLVSLAL